jgi:hypothetical protein
MILEPSHLGDATKTIYDDGVANSSGNQVHRFANGPKPGDRVIMRFANEIIGVGQIPAQKEHQYSFDDKFYRVYGWDLCHCRRVIWAEHYHLGLLADVYIELMQLPSFTQVRDGHIIEMVQSVENSYFKRKLKQMPSVDTSAYTKEELRASLIEEDISNQNIDDIIRALKQVGQLCSWYHLKEQCGRTPTENEIVSHLIIPLFFGLGWSYQQIAVEWENIDLALFDGTPTANNHCVMVLEAKRLGQPLGDIINQPLRYIKELGLNSVKIIITTDGENLFVYRRKENKWDKDAKPVRYISVSRLQKEYILPKGTDLVDTLVMLQPSMM